MPNDIANVMTELAPKGPRVVEIIKLMDWPDIPFLIGSDQRDIRWSCLEAKSVAADSPWRQIIKTK